MKAKRRSAGAEGQYVNWLLAILVIAILLALLVPGVSAGWSYRRNITITDAGTDLTYLVTLSSGQYGDMNADGSDLRFTDGGNSVKYSYWIEDWKYGGISKIWVKVPGDPSGTPPMYMWYGNSGASSESRGDATFEFFDDFDNIANWEEKLFCPGKEYGEISATGNKLVVEATDAQNRVGACTKAVQLSQGKKFEAKMVSRIPDANLIQVIWHASNEQYDNIPYTGTGDGNYAVWRRSGGGPHQLYGPDPKAAVDVTCYPYVEYRSDDNKVYFGTRSGGEVYNETSYWSDFKLGFYTYNEGTIEIDWVFVREYASTEPETTVGDQESTGGEPPVPELPTVILFSVGLIVLAGYVLLRRREKEKGK